MLLDAINAYQGEFTAKQITLQTTIATPAPTVFADGERLHQLFDNLLGKQPHVIPTRTASCLSTPHTTTTGQRYYFEDSAPAFPPHHWSGFLIACTEWRAHATERWRSRLGLSICKSMVEAHNGSIEAHPSSLGGLRIVVRLPLQGGVA
jgi:two-component system sensor histidine kinase BaeS